MMHRIGFAALSYLVPTFALGFVWHLVAFKGYYEALAMYRHDVIIPFGFLAMTLQAVLFAWVFDRCFAGRDASITLRGLPFAAFGAVLSWTLVGAFALQLPKSGRWMVQVKSVLGLVLVVVALYFLSTAFPVLARPARTGASFTLICLSLVALGLALGAVHQHFEGSSLGVKLRKATGIACVTGGAFLGITGWMKPERTLAWEVAPEAGNGSLIDAVLARARAESRPMIVDFSAAWCVACKEMEKTTFNDQRVRQEAGRFLALRVDATDTDEPRVKATMSQQTVIDLPTLILFGSNGTEAKRFTRLVEADELLGALERVN